MRECITVEDVDSGSHSTSGISASLTRELIETWCVTQLQWVASETNNTPPLWEHVVRHMRGYFVTLWAMRLLRGKATKESFVVTCNQTTMTQADIQEGNLIFLVGVAPVNPSEFLYYRIRLKSRQQVTSPRKRRQFETGLRCHLKFPYSWPAHSSPAGQWQAGSTTPAILPPRRAMRRTFSW